MALSPRLLKTVRLAHLYLGVFVAPAVLFFAFTGAVQTFSFHETTPGSSYQPARIFVVLAQIHKKQTPVVPEHRPPSPQTSTTRPGTSPALPSTPRNPPDGGAKHNPLPLKVFFLVVALSLCLSTFSGIAMAYSYARNKIAITTLLVLGTAIPVLMILL